MGCHGRNCYVRVFVSKMRLLLYIICIILFFSTKSFSIIFVKDYADIFTKYNLADDYNFKNVSTICLEKHKDNETNIYRNDKNEEVIKIKDEQGFLSCTYDEILEIIKPIPVINSLQQKPLEKFILENEITISKGLNKERITFVFNEKEYIQYKNNEEILRDGWRWGKIGKPLRVFMNGEKTTWKVSVDQMALTIKVGKEKAVPYFLTYENKQVAQKKRDDLIAKQKAEKEKIRKDKIEKERLAKLNELKKSKLTKLDNIVNDNEENYNKLFEIISIKTKMQKNTDELNSVLNQYEKTINEIRIEISNFNNFENLENYKISNDFIDPLNKILKLSENNLDILNSEYETFKIEEEKRLAEEERKRIEEEKRLAEEERKRVEAVEERRKTQRENEKLALEKKCKNFEVDNSKFDFLGVTPGISWDCFKYTFENRGFYCDTHIENILLGTFSGCEKPRDSGNLISFMKNKKSIYFTCGSFEGCDRTLREIAQNIVDKYANKFGASFELRSHFDQTTQSDVYRGSNPKDDQLIEVGTGIFGNTYVLFNQRKSVNF